jgi:hypothetical protein
MIPGWRTTILSNITPAREEGEAVEDRWWSPEPQGPRSEEEDEEDNRYINSILFEDQETKSGPPRIG